MRGATCTGSDEADARLKVAGPVGGAKANAPTLVSAAASALAITRGSVFLARTVCGACAVWLGDTVTSSDCRSSLSASEKNTRAWSQRSWKLRRCSAARYTTVSLARLTTGTSEACCCSICGRCCCCCLEPTLTVPNMIMTAVTALAPSQNGLL